MALLPNKKKSGKYNSGSSIIRDKNRNKIWAEQFSEVLNRPMPSVFPDIDEAIGETLETFETILEPPTKDEIIRAIRSLKNKGPGFDNISAEF